MEHSAVALPGSSPPGSSRPVAIFEHSAGDPVVTVSSQHITLPKERGDLSMDRSRVLRLNGNKKRKTEIQRVLEANNSEEYGVWRRADLGIIKCCVDGYLYKKLFEKTVFMKKSN